MWQACVAVLIILNFTLVLTTYETDLNSLNAITTKNFAIWKNATVPFFVEPLHFDHEQTLSILSALSMFAFKTCLKFKPVMARPVGDEDVLVFINPDGTRRCNLETKGHSVFTPHQMVLGYECLKSPQIDMMIMKALGFPFEHNRSTRDMYIEVLLENVEPGAVEFFTKEDTLPLELRFLPYDINSVMHFCNREYSKNGHRTILFKDPNAQQNRIGLSATDLKKIEIVYGPECRARDRQEKIELCQSYPGVARKKREIDNNGLENAEHSTPKPVLLRKKRDLDDMVTKSLRVNPDITPPPANITNDITITLKELGIDQEVQEIVEQIYKVSALALKHAREKYCTNNDTTKNNTNNTQKAGEDIKIRRKGSDVLGILEVVAEYAKDTVDNAVKNLTKFCEESEAMPIYQRYGCDWGSRDPRCRDTYRSTKSGPVKHSTQHRPVYQQSTKHYRDYKARQYGRARNDSNEEKETTIASVRRKRDDSTTDLVVENDGNNKQEAKKSEKDPESVKREDGNVEVAGDKKDNVKENKTEAITENKKEASENKGVKTDTVEKKEEVTVQNEEKDDKKILRMPITQLPGFDGRHNRRSGKKHRAKRTNIKKPIEEDDSMDAETERLKKKRRIKGKNRAEKRHHEEEKEEDEIPQEMDGEEIVPKKVSKKRGRINRDNIKQKDASVEDSNEGISKEVEDIAKEEKLKVKKKKRKHRLKIEQPVTVAEIFEDESTPQQRPRKEKQRGGEGSSLPRTVKLSKKNQEFYNERRWPQGQVYYMIHDDKSYDITEMRKKLAQVDNILKRKTCVRLNEITPGQANKYDDYIVIDKSLDYVTGRVGGKQKFGAIEMFQGGQHRQHTAMMVMAMLGFYFEVARHDRDKHIRVHMRHVRPDKLHHFEMIRSDATLPLPYDYASATHPAWQFWRQIGRSGISTVATFKEKDPDGEVMKSLGQNRKLLSDIDIVKINSVYGVDCFQNKRAKIHTNLKNKNESVST